MTPTYDLLVLLAGSLLAGGMLVFMLRRQPLLAQADERGLHVGARTVGWDEVRRLQYGHGGAGTWLRVGTAGGLVELRDVDLLQSPDSLRRAIVARAGLLASPRTAPPPGVRLQPGDVYEEWVPPEEAALSQAEASREQAAARDERHVPAPKTGFAKLATAVAAALAILAKFGKVSLLGGIKVLKLGKVLPTLITMLGAVWAYALLWGWWFAAGFVLLILVHELGHAVVMRAKGLRTSPIVFIPFVGAFIAIKDQFRDARTEAEVGYGGPAAGTLAASACFAIWLWTRHDLWLGLGYVGFFLNLFNLLPVSPLDGGRVVTAVSTWLWIAGLLAAGALGIVTGSPILLIVVVLGAVRAWSEFQRRRRGEGAEYFQLTPGYRALMACAYFGLCGYLAWMSHRVLELEGRLPS